MSEETAACAIADGDSPCAGLEEDDEDAVKTLETVYNSWKQTSSHRLMET